MGNAGGATHRPVRGHLRSVGVGERSGGADDSAESSDADADERSVAEPEHRRPASVRVLYAVHSDTDAASRLHLRTGRLRPRSLHAGSVFPPSSCANISVEKRAT